VALGLRRAPRLGTVLALLGVVASIWTFVAIRVGDAGWVTGLPDAPWGPLVAVFPRFEQGSTYPFVLAGLAGAAVLALLVASELRRSRGLAGAR
jgi:hypothetical protein